MTQNQPDPTPNPNAPNLGAPSGAPANRYSDDERKHLDFIQGVVSRLAGNQFLFKGWVLTVSVAVFGYAAANHKVSVALIGIAVIVGFGGLDMYFLRQERLFRHVWKGAVTRSISLYSMDPRGYSNRVRYFRGSNDENQHDRNAVLLSPPIVGLYGMLVTGGIIVAVAIGLSGSRHQNPTPAPTSKPTQSSAVPGPSR